MKNTTNPHARKATTYAACCACFAGWPVLLRGHAVWMILPIAVQVVLLVLATTELKKSKAVQP